MDDAHRAQTLATAGILHEMRECFAASDGMAAEIEAWIRLGADLDVPNAMVIEHEKKTIALFLAHATKMEGTYHDVRTRLEDAARTIAWLEARAAE